MNKVICIDGPAGSGKSTTAHAVSETLGVLFVDSGALYRIMTRECLRAGVDTSDPAAVAAFCKGVRVDFVVKGNRVAYEVGGEEPGDTIRTPEINAHVSPVSAVPEVRAIVTGWLREMPRLGDIVVEGRDIGSVVYPDSPYRFYLDCDPDERARRRQKEDASKGFVQTEEQVKDLGPDHDQQHGKGAYNQRITQRVPEKTVELLKIAFGKKHGEKRLGSLADEFI